MLRTCKKLRLKRRKNSKRRTDITNLRLEGALASDSQYLEPTMATQTLTMGKASPRRITLKRRREV